MISIIIPVYNAGKRLETTIKSAINQTYQDIEIVCVDDGSVDNSLDILQNFAKTDCRIKVIHQNNMGVSAARNRALIEATGEYIMFLDSDDWLERDACEVALNKLGSADVDIVMWPYIRECGDQSLPKEIFRQEIYFNEEDVKKLEMSDKKEAAFLLNAIKFVRGRGFDAYCTVIDCMAVAYAIDSTLVDTIEAHVGVETKDGLTLGMTVIDRRHHFVWTHLPYIKVGAKAHCGRFLNLLMDLVLA